jgi:glycosyltransferase involved in cell wall biosynthesis
VKLSRSIVYLVSQYPASNHTYILREIRALRKLGWDVHVASVRADTRPVSSLTDEEREERTQTWYVKDQGARGALRAHVSALTINTRSYFRGMLTAVRFGKMNISLAVRNFFYFTEALILGRWMQERGFRHMHIHFASTVGLLVARIFPVTMSLTIHGPAEFEDPAIFHLSEKIESSRFVRAISDYGRSKLLQASKPSEWEKLEVVRLGVDPDVFTRAPTQFVQGTTFNVISVARLSPEKNQRTLIDAVAHLASEGRQIRLRLVGEGTDRASLERHISERGLSEIVRLMGVLNQDQLRDVYRDSHAFALASRAEGLPVVLMEAMAMEIPCVATRIAGIPELIEEGVDGLLVAPSDSGQLAGAIARLMDDPDLRKRIATRARAKVTERYHLRKNVATLARVFERRFLSEAFVGSQFEAK